MVKKILILLIVAALVAGGALVIKKKKAALNSVPPPRKRPVTVEWARTERGSFYKFSNYLGTLRPKVAADLAPRVSGQIIEVRVREGEPVKKGDLLVLIDDRQQRDKVAELEARLASAKTALATQEGIFSRDETLFKAQAISQEALDRSRSATDAARAEVVSLEKGLASARTDLSYTRLYAPFDGVVTARLQDPGDLALPGKAVVALEDPGQGYYVEIKVPQSLYPLLKKGSPVRIRAAGSPSLNKGVIEASITRIHPAVRSGTLATAEVDLPAPPFGLPSGATLSTSVSFGRVKGIKVPLKALLENSDAAHIFLIDGNSRIKVISVTLLYQGPEFAVVEAEGVEGGARVVVAGESTLLRLHQGDKVLVGKEAKYGR